MAAEIANRLISLISDFDLSIRAKRARRRTAFINSQLVIAEQELREGEEALEEFQERNRLATVKLRTEKSRLEREVKLQSELFVMLRKEQTSARIAEQSEGSAISVLEKAYPPREPYTPGIASDFILAGSAGFLLAIVLAFAAEWVAKLSRQRKEIQQSMVPGGTVEAL